MSAPNQLHHQIRVFVFNFEEGAWNFLLLRRKPRVENGLGPVQGPVEIDEHLHDAVLREVREETGLVRPAHLIDLEHTTTELLGDEGIVQWNFAYQKPQSVNSDEIHPGPSIAELTWAKFDRAYQTLELPEDRSMLLRLQMHLAG